MDEKGRCLVKSLRMRQYFLWDTFQPRFLTLSILYQIVVICGITAALFAPIVIDLDQSPLASEDALQASNHFLLLHKTVWPAMLAALVMLTAHAVFFSHRIAGPLYRFRRIFSEVAAGNLFVTTAIRKGDYLHKEAECLAQMLVSLRTRIDEIEARQQEIKLALTNLRQVLERSGHPELRSQVETLRAQFEHLSQSIEYFRTRAQTQPVAETSLRKASGF